MWTTEDASFGETTTKGVHEKDRAWWNGVEGRPLASFGRVGAGWIGQGGEKFIRQQQQQQQKGCFLYPHIGINNSTSSLNITGLLEPMKVFSRA